MSMLTANVHTGMARFARGETVAPKSMTIATANPATASHLGSNPVRTPIVVVEMMKTAPILIA